MAFPEEDLLSGAESDQQALQPREEVPAEEVTAEEITAEEVTAEKVTAEEVTAEEVTAEEVRAEEITAEEATAEEVTAEEITAEEITAEELLPEEFLLDGGGTPETPAVEDLRLKAILEAIIYITEEPLSLDQIAAAIEQPKERIAEILEQLSTDYEREDRGLTIREIAGGYRMTTKPEHHEAVRRFVRNMNPPLKLSLPALETLAVIAYKQPITAPEIMEIRGVQGAGVLKTLLDRKLIGTAGRKHVVGKPILYKTTREFLVQFGLKDLAELPTLKEFQEIGRMDTETPTETPEQPRPEPPVVDLPVNPEPEAPVVDPPVTDPPVTGPEPADESPEGQDGA